MWMEGCNCAKKMLKELNKNFVILKLFSFVFVKTGEYPVIMILATAVVWFHLSVRVCVCVRGHHQFIATGRGSPSVDGLSVMAL